MRLPADDPEWMQWITILGMLACFGMLALRWQVESRLNKGGKERERVDVKKGLRRLNHSLNLNGNTAYELCPSDKAGMVQSGAR